MLDDKFNHISLAPDQGLNSYAPGNDLVNTVLDFLRYEGFETTGWTSASGGDLHIFKNRETGMDAVFVYFPDRPRESMITKGFPGDGEATSELAISDYINGMLQKRVADMIGAEEQKHQERLKKSAAFKRNNADFL